MKQTKISYILVGLLAIFTIVGITYATSPWQAGNGIQWIAEPDNTYRFTEVKVGITDVYLDSATGLKWEKKPSTITMQWATDRGYTEPIWDGENYIRTFATEEDGGHAIGTSIGGLDTDYPIFAYCRNKGSGWRVPTRKELQTIISYTDKNEKLSLHPNVLGGLYWTGTQKIYHYHNIETLTLNAAWVIEFSRGYIYDQDKTDEGYLLCLHD